MAGGTIASLVARVGADTSDFHGKMDAAVIKAGSVQAGFDRVGKRIGGGISQPLLLAGLAAQKFGGQITTSFMDAAGVTSKLVVQTNGLFLATGQLADATLLAIASMGKLSGVKLSTASFNAATLGMAVSAGSLSYAITRLLAELTGLDNFLVPKAGKAVQQLGEVLAFDEERFRGAADQLARLTAQLHLSGPAWAFEAKWTWENAKRVSELTDKVLANIRSRRALGETMKGYLAGLQAEEGLHRRNIATLDALRLKFDQAYGVMTRAQLTDALGKLASDVRLMAEQGIPWVQVMDKVAPRFKELADFAGTYVGFNMPQQAADLGEAFRDETGGALDSLLAKWSALPPAIKTGAEESGKFLDQMGDRLKGSISGGFGKGIEEGTNFARQQVDAWIAELESRPIKLRVDASAVQKAFDDALSGRIPKTTGSAP